MASATPTAPAPTLSVSLANTLSRAAQATAGVLLLLAVVKVVAGGLLITTTTLAALLGIVQGLILVFLALILIKIATDFGFARDVPHLSNAHLLNALDSWQDFCKTLIALAVFIFLTALLR